MQPYATASEPSPLNGNRPSVNVNANANANANANNSFFTKYRNPILYSLGVIVLILIVTMIIRKRRSFYDVEKVETSKKVKKCPKGCVPAPKKKKVVKDPKKGTSFDPKLTSK
jgi:hypothetical protein